MHYLFEQIGYTHIPELVQSGETGIEDIKKLLTATGALNFSSMFHNWSIALYLNNRDLSPAYGYNHPLRHSLSGSNTIPAICLPDVSTIDLPSLSIQAISILFARELFLEAERGNTGIKTTVIQEKMAGPSHIIDTHSLQGTQKYTNPETHGSFRLIFTNPTIQTSVNDSTILSETVMFHGERSAQANTLSYDDGVADIFHENASYLLLTGTRQAIATVFTSPVKSWLTGIWVKTLFRNELQGTNLPQTAARDVVIQITTVENGYPATPLTPSFTRTINREFGNLKYEYISLNTYYSELHPLPDSFSVIIRNAPNDTNWVAFGMDSTSVSHSLIFQTKSSNENFWQKMEQVTIETDTLAHWNPMVRAEVVSPPLPASIGVMPIRFRHDYTWGYLEFQPPFQLDTLGTKCIVRSPSGQITEAVYTGSQPPTFQFPIEVEESNYHFYLHLETMDAPVIMDTMLTWQLPVPRGFALGNNYPNPFNAFTTLPLQLLFPAELSVEVFDLMGRRVQIETLGTFLSGKHDLEMDLSSHPSGIYFIRLVAQNREKNLNVTRVQPVMLIK